nr:site-specific integrase [Pseudomonas sp.]
MPKSINPPPKSQSKSSGKRSRKAPAPGSSIKPMAGLTFINSEPPRLYYSDSGAPVEFYNESTASLWDAIGTSYSRNSAIAMSLRSKVFAEFIYLTGLSSAQLEPDVASKTMSLYASYLTEGAEAKDAIIREAFIRSGRKPISARSASAYVDAANQMLASASEAALERIEMARILTKSAPKVEVEPLPALNPRVRSRQEMSQIHANTLQVKPALHESGRIARGGLPAPKFERPREVKHIAVDHIIPLLENAPTPLDGVVWGLCSGSLRISEAISIRLEDIDVRRRRIRVHDPKGLRNTANKKANDENQVREKSQFGFKGRATALVTMFEPFKSIFWQWLQDYLAVRPASASPWLLLSFDEDSYGTPLRDLNSNSVNRAINRDLQATQEKLGLEAPQGRYSSHAFRHFYGIWARNYVAVPGRPKPGLELSEIQLLMGHATKKTTEQYAADLGINALTEIDAANELVYYHGAGKGIDHYRGEAYAKLAEHLLGKDPQKEPTP